MTSNTAPETVIVRVTRPMMLDYLANFGIDAETFGADGVECAMAEMDDAVWGGVRMPIGYASDSRIVYRALTKARMDVGITWAELAAIAGDSL